MKSTYLYLNNINSLKYKVISSLPSDELSTPAAPDNAACVGTPLALPVDGLNPVDAAVAVSSTSEPVLPDNIDVNHANNTQRVINESDVPPASPIDPNVSKSWAYYKRGFEVIKNFAINNWQLLAMAATNIGLELAYSNIEDLTPAIGGIFRGIDATLFMHWLAVKNAKGYVKGKITNPNSGLRKELDRVYKVFGGKSVKTAKKVEMMNNLKVYFTVSSLLNGIEDLRGRVQREREVMNKTGVSNPAILRDLINYLDSGVLELNGLLQDVNAPSEVRIAVDRLAAFNPINGDTELVTNWLNNYVEEKFTKSNDPNITEISNFFTEMLANGTATAMDNKAKFNSFLKAFDAFLHESNAKHQSKIKSLQRRLLITQATQVIMGISLIGIIGVNSFTQDVSVGQKMMNFVFFLTPILYYATDGAINFYNQLRTFFDKNAPEYGDTFQNELDNPMMGAVRYPYAHNNMDWVFQDLISNVMMDDNFVGTENIFSSSSMLRRQAYGIVTVLNAAKARYTMLSEKFKGLLEGLSDDAKKMIPLLLSVDKYHTVPVEISIQRAVNNVLAGYEDTKAGYLTTFETLLLGFPQQDAGKHRTEQGRLLVESVLFKMQKTLGLSNVEIRLLVDRFNIGDFNHYDFESMLRDALVNDLGWGSKDSRIESVVTEIVGNKEQYQKEAVLAYAHKEGIPAQHAAAIMQQMIVVFEQESLMEKISEVSNNLRKGILIDKNGKKVSSAALQKELQSLLAKAFYGTETINNNLVKITDILVRDGAEITKKSYEAYTLKDPMSDPNLSKGDFKHLVDVRRRLGIMGLNEKNDRGENFEANQIITLFYSIRNMIADRDSGNTAGYESKLTSLYFILTGEALAAGSDMEEAYKKITESYEGLLKVALTDFKNENYVQLASGAKDSFKYFYIAGLPKGLDLPENKSYSYNKKDGVFEVEGEINDKDLKALSLKLSTTDMKTVEMLNNRKKNISFDKDSGVLTAKGAMTAHDYSVLKTFFPSKQNLNKLEKIYEKANNSDLNQEILLGELDLASPKADQQLFDIVTRLNLIGVVDTGRLLLENGGLPGTVAGESNSLTLALATRAAMLAGKAEAGFYDEQNNVDLVFDNSARAGRYDAYFNMAYASAEEGIRSGFRTKESLDMIRTKTPGLRDISTHVTEKAVEAFLPSYEENQVKIGQMYLGMGSGLARDAQILDNFVQTYRSDALGLKTALDPKIDAVADANAELVAQGSKLSPDIKSLIDLLYTNYMFQGDARGNIRLFGKTTGALTYDQLADYVISSLENGQMDIRFRHAGRDFYIDLNGKDEKLLTKALASSGYMMVSEERQNNVKENIKAYCSARETQVTKLTDLEDVVMNHKIEGGEVFGDSMVSLYNEPIFRLIFMKLAGVNYVQDLAPMDVKAGEDANTAKDWLNTLNSRDVMINNYKNFHKMPSMTVLDAYSDTSTATNPELEALRAKPAKLPAFITGGKADQTNINSSHYGKGRIATQMRETRLTDYISQRLQIINNDGDISNIEIPPMLLNNFEYEVTGTLNKSQSELMLSNATYATALQFMVSELDNGANPAQAGKALVEYWKTNLNLTDADVVGGSLKALQKTCVSFAKALKVNMAIPDMTGGISALYAMSESENVVISVPEAYNSYLNNIDQNDDVNAKNLSEKIDAYVANYIKTGNFNYKEAKELKNVAKRMKRNILVNDRIKGFTETLLNAKEAGTSIEDAMKAISGKISGDKTLDMTTKGYLAYYMKEVSVNIEMGKNLNANDWVILKGEWYTFSAQFLYRTPADMNKEAPSGRRLTDALLPWRSKQNMYQSFLFTRSMTMEEINALNSSAQGQYVGLTKQVPEEENFRGLKIPAASILRNFASFFDKYVSADANEIIAEYTKFQKLVRVSNSLETFSLTAKESLSEKIDSLVVSDPVAVINMAKVITGDQSINDAELAKAELMKVYDSREFTLVHIQTKIDRLIHSKLKNSAISNLQNIANLDKPNRIEAYQLVLSAAISDGKEIVINELPVTLDTVADLDNIILSGKISEEAVAKAVADLLPSNPEGTERSKMAAELIDYFDDNLMPGSMYVLYEKLFGIKKPRTHTNHDVDNFTFENSVNKPGILKKVHYLNYDPVTGVFHKTRHGMIQGSQNIAEKSQPVTTPFANLDQIWNDLLLKLKGYNNALYANGCFFIQRLDVMAKSQMFWQDIEQGNATMTSDSRISRSYNANRKMWTELQQNHPMIYSIVRKTLVGASISAIPLIVGMSATVSSVPAMAGILLLTYLSLSMTSADKIGFKADNKNAEIKKNFMYGSLASVLGASMIGSALLALSWAQPLLDQLGNYQHQLAEFGVMAFAAMFAAGVTTWITENVGFTKVREKVMLNAAGRAMTSIISDVNKLLDTKVIDVSKLSDVQSADFNGLLDVYANCKADANFINRNKFFAGYVSFFNILFDANSTEAQKKDAFKIITESNGKILANTLMDSLGLESSEANSLIDELKALSLINDDGELSDNAKDSEKLAEYLIANFPNRAEEIKAYLHMNYYKNLMLKANEKDMVSQIYSMLSSLSNTTDSDEVLDNFCKMMKISKEELNKLFDPSSPLEIDAKKELAEKIKKSFYELHKTKGASVPGDMPIACKKFISRFEDYKTTSATEDAFSWITNYFMGWNTQAMPGGMPLGMAGANTSFDVVVPQRGGRWYSSTSAFLSYAIINDVYQNWQTRPADTAAGTISTLMYGYSGIAKMQLMLGVPMVALGYINPFFFLTTMGLTSFTLFSFANYSSAMQSNRIARMKTGALSYGVDLALYSESKIHMPTALKETIARGGIKPEQTMQIMNLTWGDILKKPADPYSWIMAFNKLTNPVTSPLHNAGFNITVEMAGSTQPKFKFSLHTGVALTFAATSGILFLKMMDSIHGGAFTQVPYFGAFLFWSYIQLRNALGTEHMARLGANNLIEGQKKSSKQEGNSELGKLLQGAGEHKSQYRSDREKELFR